MNASFIGYGLLLSSCLFTSAAWGQDKLEQAKFEKALELQTAGKINQAIEFYETQADRGIVHETLSFNRGLAYAQRGLNENAVGHQNTDLGQASAAWMEARFLSANPGNLDSLLLLVQEKITQSLGPAKGEVIELIPLKERLLRTLNINWLFIFSCLSSVLTTGFLCFELRDNLRVKLRARIAASFTSLGLISSVFLCSARSNLAQSESPAVITAPRAPLLDQNGRKAHGFAALSQGTLVYQTQRAGRLVRVAEQEGQGLWVQSMHLRPLARP